jgi:Anaphase-promoting complex APC subunit CDC26
MLRRQPTRVELSQADIDDLDVVRREREEAAAGPTLPPATRREAAVGNKTDRQRLGLPILPADRASASAVTTTVVASTRPHP